MKDKDSKTTTKTHKQTLVLEYLFGHIPMSLLWENISTTHGLSEWFADKVVADGIDYTFYWDDESESAILKQSRLGVYVRFHWTDDDNPKSFFEFRINEDALTRDVVLSITDMVDPEEVESATELWNLQVADLQKKLGV
ncbi:MAG: START-like domain-containing protein [Paludibacteraceae bacterium]|nr:hypothetical protein [Candidatus Physcocola equi]MCQ2234110.1 START-like domain-containing protein [Paludibacteraceae bacterium]